MNFKLGKKYIVKVSEEGIIPIEEFKSDRFYDKDHDDLDFLTDEEKIIVINDVLDKIRAEFISLYPKNYAGELELGGLSCVFSLNRVLNIIDKYEASPTGEEDKE